MVSLAALATVHDAESSPPRGRYPCGHVVARQGGAERVKELRDRRPMPLLHARIITMPSASTLTDDTLQATHCACLR